MHRYDAQTEHGSPACLLQLNLYLMAFNLLLPAYPLDGGRIFADAMVLCRVPVRVAAYITAGLAVAIAVALIAWGVVREAFITVLVRRHLPPRCELSTATVKTLVLSNRSV